MAAKTMSPGSVFMKIVLGLLMLFALSVPLFYADAALSLAGKTVPLLYILLRTLRLAAAAGLGWRLRRQYYTALCVHETARRYMVTGTVLCAALLAFRFDVVDGIYLALGRQLGLMYSKTGPLLPSVVWEQFMSGDLLWALVVCAAIVFVHFTPPKGQRVS